MNFYKLQLFFTAYPRADRVQSTSVVLVSVTLGHPIAQPHDKSALDLANINQRTEAAAHVF